MQIGSGYGALNILTPNEAANNTYETQINQAKSQLETATLPDQIATSAARSQLAQVQVQEARNAAMLRQTAAQQAMIANAAATATTPDEWDAQMEELADQGIDRARQFVGRYSLDLQHRLTSAYSAGNAPAALAAMSGQADTSTSSPLAGVPMPGSQAELEATYGGMKPEEMQQHQAAVGRINDAIRRIETSPNPGQQWDREAVALGLPQYVGRYDNGAGLARLKAEVQPHFNYLQGRTLQNSLGIPAPVAPMAMEKVGDELVGIDKSNPGKPNVVPLYEGPGTKTLVGTDPDGHAIYLDNRSGQETIGANKLNAKPGTGGGRGSVFEAKRQAWLEVHPGDTQGALQFAGGAKGLDPQHAMVAAASAAARDAANAALTNQPFDEKAARDEYFREFTTASQPPPAGAGAGGFTAAQRSFEQQYPPDPRSTAGSRARPYYAATQADYARFAPGSFYVGPDGKLRQKPKR